jgi:hypothetical protein
MTGWVYLLSVEVCVKEPPTWQAGYIHCLWRYVLESLPHDRLVYLLSVEVCVRGPPI